MSDQPEKLDLLRTSAKIAEFIGFTKRQTYEALTKGELPARRVNGRWVASRKALRDFFEGVSTGEAQSAPQVPQPHMGAVADGIIAGSKQERQPKPVRRTTNSTGAKVHRLLPRASRKGRAA